MSYLKVKYRKIINEIDQKLKLPKGWEKFVENEVKKDNFIIKKKGKCICGNCQNEFKSDKKVNEIERCPKCKMKYLVKRSNYKWHNFKSRKLVLLDRFEDDWLIRLFSVESYYINGKIRRSEVVEYGRILVNNNLNFVNNRFYRGMYGYEKIKVYEDIKGWREYSSWYKSLSASGKLFSGNLKRLFENTEYKYSQLWTLAQKEDDIDIRYYLNNNLPSTEMLIKMKLYKLALCPKTFNRPGSFEKRFGLDKSYYKFMKRYNIDVDELNVLKIYKKKDIKKIRYLSNFNSKHLKRISKYMSLDKFIKYVKQINGIDMQTYYDYIGFLEDLELNLKNKKYLFPENIKEAHDKYEKQIQIRGEDVIEKNISKRYKELERNRFSDNKYFITPARSIGELEDESKQQNNCVRTYAKGYSKGECDIYFMREENLPSKSLVTVEVQDNQIVQSRTKFNYNTDREQQRFLKRWEYEILNAA